MTRLPLTVCLALAWFFAVNTLVSAAVAAGRTWSRTRLARRGEALGGRDALAWRLLPVAVALAVTGVFVSAFLAYEPSGGPEPIGWTLCAAALAALLLTAAGCCRGALLARRARVLVHGWQAGAVPVDLHDLTGTGIRAYAVRDRFPVVALVGIWRPRLFIARQVLSTLSRSELRVVIAHEVAHRRAWDNAKRTLLAWTPDVLGWLAAGRRLERQWAAEAERAADRSAAGGSRRQGIDLAGALVKVSRLASAPAPPVPLFSTFHERGAVGDRVRRLVIAPVDERTSCGGRIAVAVGAAVVAAASLPHTWQSLHAISEVCVRLLP